MKKLFILAFAGLICYGCKNKPQAHTGLPYFNSADFTPEWINKSDPAFTKLHTIPPFAFADQNGDTISQKTTKGKIYVANFFFTRCGNICPLMMKNLKKVSQVFKGDNNVLLISHSVTPWYDNVNTLKTYAENQGITNPNWHLVTGSKIQIYTIARKGYFADSVTNSAITTTFLHTENLILVDRSGHIRGVYNGTVPVEINNLIRHIKLLEHGS